MLRCGRETAGDRGRGAFSLVKPRPFHMRQLFPVTGMLETPLLLQYMAFGQLPLGFLAHDRRGHGRPLNLNAI